MSETDSVAPLEAAPAAPAREKVDWLAELRGLALMLLAVVAFHSLIAKPFYIPSVSMMPSLLVGDRLVVSKYPYGWSWVSASFHVLPRAKWRVWGTTPERGDIVIVVPPDRDIDYIKRVIGLPGDTIEVVNGQIVLNGKPVPQAVLDNYPEIRVPRGHVFLMGDNRDHSADSRAPAGFEQGLGGPVPLADVGGRAEFITFSLDGSTTLAPRTWLASLRRGRAWTNLRAPQTKRGRG
ncbi:MAG: signal peptidase I [Novosphingobium sp.]|nr:signal peptidase I [Novosphingobium sp.]